MHRRGSAAAALLVLLLVLLAGCSGGAPPKAVTGDTVVQTGPAPPSFAGECSNVLLFQFVEYAATDRYLPPGFHPRDPQAFLGSPAAFGRAGVLLIVLECLDIHGETYSSASVDIFTEAPFVEGLEPSTFNFYEVERIAPPGPFDQVLAESQWPTRPGEVAVNATMAMTADAAAGSAEVFDAEGRVALVGGSMEAPVPLGPSTVRFWHDGPAGLAYVEYAGDLQPLTGPAYCFLRPGTPMADFARSTPVGELGQPGTVDCPPGEPVAATFPHFHVQATAQRFPGVHAQ